MKAIQIVILCCILSLYVVGQSTSPKYIAGQSTSPNITANVRELPKTKAQRATNASEIITFNEYPIGTQIASQYQDIGIIFGGSGPFISSDNANPTSPVLSGTPLFNGDIVGIFVEPGTDQPTVVESFSLDAGYFDEIGSTRIEWFDPDGNKIGQRINSSLGIEQLTIEGGNIASWRIGIVQNEPAGFAIDNVSFVPIGPSVLFREKSDDNKDGSWGIAIDEIPGFDHSGFQIGNLVYESHPAYSGGTYVSADGTESVFISGLSGVQAQHSRATFKHDSMSTGFTPVVDIEEIPVKEELARSMRDIIESVRGTPFQFIDYNRLAETLSPAVQKGGNGAFTCVGLIEWAAEQAGHNGGQGFIRNVFESFQFLDLTTFPPKTIEVPLLSPQLLNYAMKGQQLLQDANQWVQGLFDPVDFIVTDPLGRRLGFVQGIGRLNEIPNAFYSGNGGVEQFLILNAIPGAYIIEYVGTGNQVFGAVSALGTSDSFSGFLAHGQTNVRQLFVEPKAGAGGDVDGDGDVDHDDIQMLTLQLNKFTDGLGNPGDLDGDGLLSNADLALLTELVDILGASGYEADVAPRPDGSGTVVVSDWVQVGRFSVGLDTPAPGSEFQRADCAPRATLGDGQITVADWVQAGRYSVGLDPLTPAGGPTQLIAFAPSKIEFSSSPRELRVATERVRISGGVMQVPIDLIALGGESGLTFSLQYDPGVFEYAGVEAGRDVINGSDLLVNDLYINGGRLGIGVRLKGQEALMAGERGVLVVNFRLKSESFIGAEVVIGPGPAPLGLAGKDGNTLPLNPVSKKISFDR